MRLTKLAAVIAAQWILLPGVSKAHDYWVMPDRFDPAPGTTLEAHFSAGHAFFVNETVPDVTRFRGLLVLPDGREVMLPYQRVASTEATLSAPIVGEGTYILGAVSTQPEYWSTVQSGHAPGSKTELPNAISTTQYVKSVKTVLNVGQPTESWAMPLGHAIEIVPQANPASLESGDSLGLRVLLQGQPAAGAEVHAVYEGFESDDQEAPVSTTSDDQGQARLTFDRPGVWLVYARVERDAPSGSGIDQENFRSYLLMRVAPDGVEARP